jgi:diguanylate cyclase (GGDEF)-like protein/PAS domain S-box-containing protein
LVGAAAVYISATGTHMQVHPSPGGVLYLVSYLPLALGLLALGRPVIGSRDWPTALDTIAVTLAGALLVWILLVRPAVMTMHMMGTQKISATVTWVGYMAVMAACARLLMLWRGNASAIILSVGVAAYLVADFVYGRALIHVGPMWPIAVAAGLMTLYGLSGLAALLPSMAHIATRSVGDAKYEIGPGQLVLLAIALLVGPSTLLVEATAGPVTTGVAIALVVGVVGLLVLTRLALGAQAYRRRGASTVALRKALRSLVVATAVTEVTACLTSALREMTPRGAGSHASVIEHGKGGAAGSAPGTRTTLVPQGRRHGELLVRVGTEALPVSGSYKIMFSAPLRFLVEYAAGLEALAEQAAAALARIDLVGALRVEERERYFRTLVLTSTDATLISRHGRIDYATPSARAMFGRDVRGAVLDDVIRPASIVVGEPGQFTVDGEKGHEATIRRPDGVIRTVQVQQRDLTGDPTVNGVVVTVRDVTAERELQRSLAYRASHDALTGLANADQLRQRLRVARDCADGGLCAVIFVDLDDFKQVNDSYGHEVGDGLLVNVAYRIRALLRGEDLAARLGGDEFAALLHDVPDEEAARRTARRIADSLARPVTVAGVLVDCGASVGLALARSPAEFDSLLRRADTALYTAKEEGKGHWREYEAGMISPIRRRNDLRLELENAMRDDRLALHYQPIVDLASGRAVGFEALVRYERSAGGSIPAQELIRIAEENGLIVPLGDWVVRRAVHDLPRLGAAGGGTRPYVSVNVSPNQLRDTDFADSIRETLRSSDVDPSLLVLEITERLLVAEDAQEWEFLDELREAGVRVAIDDYGTGCAALSYLRRSTIDIVKIDQSFVQDLTTERDQALLEAVVALTVRLGLTQIAEGVPDARARDLLRGMGCRFGQGYFYSPALPLADAIAWADSRLLVGG